MPIVSVPSAPVEVYDFIEITVAADVDPAKNPFQDVRLTGSFTPKGYHAAEVEGFCDAADGLLFRIRYMPCRAGVHQYKLRFDDGTQQAEFTGEFTAIATCRRGPLCVDRECPTHFTWQGTGEHFFWNATTTYFLLGWQDDHVIQRIIDRLHTLGANRMRVAINGRTPSGARWQEKLVQPTEEFHFRLEPWVASSPEDISRPGINPTRFNVRFWQRVEKALRYARQRDMIFDIIFYVDGQDPGVDPFGKEQMGGELEQLYYRYGAARLAAFSNITWDITNEWRNFRTVEWVNQMGTLLKSLDPYKHVVSCHGHEDFPFANSPWCDYVMYQRWDENGGHDFLVKAMAEQAASGRAMPIVNEEYGYEDHYPQGWGGARQWPARTADNRRRLAWSIYMAGCYQTTGERANGGTGAGEDTGGGWINGRGDESMTMLRGYGHIVRFFESMPWWRLKPAMELVKEGGALLLAEPGKRYIAYLPCGTEPATLELTPGRYFVRWYNCRTGDWRPCGDGDMRLATWTTTAAADAGDWALLIEAV